MKRFLVSLCVMLVLLAASRLYSFVMTPLVTAAIPTMSDRPAQDVSIRTPTSFETQAMKVFPESEWTHKSGHAWEIAEEMTMYFQNYQRVVGTGNTLEISPVAVVWTDPKHPESPPYRMQAERAQVKFQNAFFDKAISLSDSQPGRIVWASLEGLVKIDGPDGLLIQGENFKFEEESLQLYSDFPIEFNYGPTPIDSRKFRGKSMQMELRFLPAEGESLGRDMPRIAGLSQILLRRNVNLETTFEKDGLPRQVVVSSRGPVLYDVVQKICTIDDFVEVRNLTWKEGTWLEDLIQCDWLKLVLSQILPEPQPLALRKNTSFQSFAQEFEGLELASVEARGADSGKDSRIKFKSTEQNVTAEMQSFSYAVDQRKAVLTDGDYVLIHRGEATFKCPVIHLTHTEDGKGLEQLTCLGAGTLEIYEKNFGENPILARWSESVLVQQDAESALHIVELNKAAQISLPEQMGLSADHLYLWVDLEEAQKRELSDQAAPGVETVGNERPAVLALHRARALGNVSVMSEMVNITRTNLIDVFLSAGKVEPRIADNELFSKGNKSQTPSRERQQYPAELQADQIAVDLIFDAEQPKNQQLDFRKIAGTGSVRITYQPDEDFADSNKKMRGQVNLQADSLVVENHGGTRQVLTLHGIVDSLGQLQSRALLAMGDQSLWGGNITISRSENRVDVKGPGGLSAPVPKQSLGGNAGEHVVLASNSSTQDSSSLGMMDLVWADGMTFDGKVAHCWGKITATLPNDNQDISRLLCEDLKATLSHRISFLAPNQIPENLSMDLLNARHNVVVESREWEQNKLVGMRQAEIASVAMNQKTGEFSGVGPGIMHSWSLGDQVKLVPNSSPQANRPDQTDTDQKWRYVSVKFAGNVTGNINHNEALLTDRVEMMTAPVARPGVKFYREQLSAKTPESENAVWIECQQLKIIRKLVGKERSQFFEFLALNDAHLESHVFHAYADELSYDQRAGMFVMRGLGKDANLYVQKEVGAPPHRTSALDITFNPSKWDISTGGLKGFSSGN